MVVSIMIIGNHGHLYHDHRRSIMILPWIMMDNDIYIMMKEGYQQFYLNHRRFLAILLVFHGGWQHFLKEMAHLRHLREAKQNILVTSTLLTL